MASRDRQRRTEAHLADRPGRPAQERRLALSVAVEVQGLVGVENFGGPTHAEITGGLRELMEQYGEVLNCQIERYGVDEPVVYFATQKAAEDALEALGTQQVSLFGRTLSGIQLEKRGMPDRWTPGAKRPRTDVSKQHGRGHWQ